MEIRSISEKIFKSSPNKNENAGLQTNPFGVSFKGNIITADVFEKTDCQNKQSFGSRVVGRIEKSRMAMSVAFGSINQALGARINSVANFGRRIKANAVKAWGYLSENSLKMTLGLVKNESKDLFRLNLGHRDYSVGNLLKKDPSDIGAMWKESLNVRAEQRLAMGV